ncbi:unnamed protein product [Vitrella brassicaformis CCMP3155]|uniref:Uncharacterized protein n=1 Tax=Vitrella brassicaformis (strain CCMP3155) TaxID=1169540 RepID=A0A0G4EXN8_VITBC|nr:unnamed protein product [Vitrella brassicaformis CCMP3155]|mmetsp:Transcript_47881/g.119789  ORF Transcript_47881/g.119789 Transcript_47881/m.119789 type:complete len:178 (-) Transcript_47881:1588-2121(-)|eukprot:CEM04074.1 unnamed protein product [Vitrella brassicaformis CCMP3155]
MVSPASLKDEFAAIKAAVGDKHDNCGAYCKKIKVKKSLKQIWTLNKDAARSEAKFYGDADCSVRRIGKDEFAALEDLTKDTLTSFGVHALFAELDDDEEGWDDSEAAEFDGASTHDTVRQLLDSMCEEPSDELIGRMTGGAGPDSFTAVATVYDDGNTRVGVAETADHFYCIRFDTS